MSDLFHEQIPFDFIERIFLTMNDTPWHNYQILTKRTKRLLEVSHNLNWTPNIWQGVTVENNSAKDRIDDLRLVPSYIRFLSLEPLIDQISNLILNEIHWAIVGGESGLGARPMKIEWVRSIRDCCISQHVPFFFKQWGGPQKHLTGRILDNRTWDEYPESLSTLLHLPINLQLPLLK